MSEDNLDESELSIERWTPTPHDLAGGIPRRSAIILTVLSVVGIFASLQLILSELKSLADPDAELFCDINPLVDCSSSLNTWQAHLFFGVPNSVIGLGFFTVLATTGVILAAGIQLPRWYWWGLTAGISGSLIMVFWFLWQSVTFFQKLCPYCMVVWIVTIPLAVIIWGRALYGKSIPSPNLYGRLLLREGWAFMVILYIIVILIVVLGMGKTLLLMF